jgi:quercetin dioxygenase-like cupin family protein
MYKSIILIKIILLAMSPFVSAQTQIDEIDPTVVSATMYKVLLENEHVRVVEYQVLPGEKDNWHTHPAKVSYIVTGGSLKITTEAGESFIVEEEMGAATWFEAVGKHYGENVGKTPVRIVFVEIKEIGSAREDINKYRRD